MARPSRSAAIQSPFGHPHAGGGAVPGEDHVAGCRIDRGEVRQFAVRRLDDARVLQLELLDDVRDPALAEAFPGQHVDAAGAEQRPQGHLDGARIGRRHDADPVVGRHFQNLAGEVDGALQAALAELRTVRAAEGGILEMVEGPAGALGAGSGRKERRAWARGGRRGHDSILPDGRPSVGRGLPPPDMTKTACPVKVTGWPWGAGAVPKMRPVAYMTQSSLARLPPMAYKDEKPSLACDML